jgi:hypothetical protein
MAIHAVPNGVIWVPVCGSTRFCTRVGYRKCGCAPAYPREHGQIHLVKLLC